MAFTFFVLLTTVKIVFIKLIFSLMSMIIGRKYPECEFNQELCKNINLQKQPTVDVLIKRCSERICSNLTGEHLCRSIISIKLQSNFIETPLRYECSPVNLLHIFRSPFPKNTSGGLLLNLVDMIIKTLNMHSEYPFAMRIAVFLNDIWLVELFPVFKILWKI